MWSAVLLSCCRGGRWGREALGPSPRLYSLGCIHLVFGGRRPGVLLAANETPGLCDVCAPTPGLTPEKVDLSGVRIPESSEVRSANVTKYVTL